MYWVGKWQGWGQFSSGIEIAAQFQFHDHHISELELELKLVELDSLMTPI